MFRDAQRDSGQGNSSGHTHELQQLVLSLESLKWGFKDGKGMISCNLFKIWIIISEKTKMSSSWVCKWSQWDGLITNKHSSGYPKYRGQTQGTAPQTLILLSPLWPHCCCCVINNLICIAIWWGLAKGSPVPNFPEGKDIKCPSGCGLWESAQCSHLAFPLPPDGFCLFPAQAGTGFGSQPGLGWAQPHWAGLQRD